MKDSNDWNRDTRADAQSHFLTLSRFPFIIALMKDVLAHTKALSTRLQGRYIDIVKAYKEVEFVKSTLKGARDGVDGFHMMIPSMALGLSVVSHLSTELFWFCPRKQGRYLTMRCYQSTVMNASYMKESINSVLSFRIGGEVMKETTV